ncbi:MAG: asparagine synthase (glutamine-hydrolyzing) [Bacteroidetes bacterium]|nr:asparagine synthase (glutamine-hydrolyzing) [Bacteroidota bacterium]MBS1973260.1 asparagine synthase (glutamine-hydrolyzing) [Bacteroidota bacterium]
MCGISIAINSQNARVPQEQIKAMNDKVNHRGPDDEGFYFGDNFSFGHRRLSIIDLSKAGHQPMQRGHLWITYNGEIYNYIELREELKKLGCCFETATDTEVILAAYEQWGTGAFARFNGMWAFAIYDALNEEIICCRDHFGIKPFFFVQTDNWFLAGSEIKQFTAFPDFKPMLNKEVAANFLAYGLLNYSEQTFFRGVMELQAGHYLRYNLTGHKSKVLQWYDLDSASIKVGDDFETAKKTIRELFVESVRLRMRSDVTVGSCLSGGIDSSSIVSMVHANQLANASFATVTSCYNDPQYDEQQYSDAITDQTGFRPIKVFPNLDCLWDEGHLDKMLYHQDQPFSTASHYSEFSVFKKAKEENIIVMLDGQGSDEYLCGYGEFFNIRVHELLMELRFKKAWQLLCAKAKHRNVSFASQLKYFLQSAYFFKLAGFVKKCLGREDNIWLQKEWRTLARKGKGLFNEKNIRALSITEIVHSSIPYQLHSEDRNSMMFSIESRLPFLDHRLVEYIIGLPSSFKINEGYSKYIFREAMAELPGAIRWRKDKMGFVAPDEVWVLQNKDKVRANLHDAIKHTGIFTVDLLNRFDRFTAGKLGYEAIYFRAMALYRFCRIFNMASS